MDSNKEFDDLQSCMKNFNTSEASEMLSDTGFITKHSGDIIHLLGEGLTEENFKNKPDYFNFCEEQLLKIARSGNCQEIFIDLLELIDTNDCMLSSSVLAVVTLLENTESPSILFLEYLLHSTFSSLNEMDETRLKEILMSVVQHLSKLKKHFQHQQSVLYYFARVAFLVLRANIDPIAYVNALSNVINDPFCLLEIEFEEQEERLYMASFFYLYFKTEMSWGPKVYNHFYVLEKCSRLALSVFQNNDFGKSFAKMILTKFEDNEIPLHALNACHEEFCMEAAQSSMYQEQTDIRKISIDSLVIFVRKLSVDAQYVTLRRLFSSPIDSCVKSQLVITMKDLVLSKMRSNQDLGDFRGARLLEIIRLCCSIPDGPKCHVIENQSLVLATITLVHGMHGFLTAEHHSGFRRMLNMGVEFHDHAKQFVKTVQSAIDCTSELCEIESKKLDGGVECVQNEVIPDFPDEKKRETLSAYNTYIRLMQTHLNMLKEAVENE